MTDLTGQECPTYWTCTIRRTRTTQRGVDFFLDGQLAATALVHGLTLVTRNTDDVAPSGVPSLNPWEP